MWGLMVLYKMFKMVESAQDNKEQPIISDELIFKNNLEINAYAWKSSFQYMRMKEEEASGQCIPGLHMTSQFRGKRKW